jgi:DNA repair protein RadA/Sms
VETVTGRQVDRKTGIQVARPIKLSEINVAQTKRISTGIAELDRVLGGGLVPGMAVLLAGEPGVGKSTLLLQLADRLSKSAVLYIAGEESASQIKIRAERLGVMSKGLEILETTDVDAVRAGISPPLQLIIVDSIQTLTTEDLSGTAGSVGQVRECANRLINQTKNLGTPLILVGHVTKDGTIAGPKVLEHIVDTVLTIEGDKYSSLRIVRTSKNRFGPTDEVGIFEMKDSGLVATEPALPAEALRQAGSCLTIIMEGTRPILAEVQALVTPTPIPNPRRVASGVDHNRLLTITAILQKRLNLPLYKEDIYVSVSGGLKITEPAGDLAIALAILSCYRNKPLPPKSVAFGELDLLGNVRKVSSQEKRSREAKARGLTHTLSTLQF